MFIVYFCIFALELYYLYVCIFMAIGNTSLNLCQYTKIRDVVGLCLFVMYMML